MKKDDHDRQKLAGLFEDFEAEPQVESWERIRLGIRKKRKKRPLIWLWGFLGTAVVASAFFAVFLPAKQANMQEVNSTTNHDNMLCLPDLLLPSIQKESMDYPITKSLSGSTIDECKPLRPQMKMKKNLSIFDTQILEKETFTTIFPLKNLSNPDDLIQLPQRAVFPKTTSPPTGFPALPATVSVVSRKRHQRKGEFTADFTMLSAFQSAQSQIQGGIMAANIQALPTFDAHRQGTSLALGYRLPLQKRSDLSVSMTWMRLPFRAQYDVAATNQVRINFQSAHQYQAERIVQSTVNETRHLNWWGLRLDYGYFFRLGNKKIRVYAGGEGLMPVSTGNPTFWAITGLNIPIGHSHYQLVPTFKYQFNYIEQSDQLLKTRLYGLGVGIKRHF